jgi:ureidoglycolate hydrolase
MDNNRNPSIDHRHPRMTRLTLEPLSEAAFAPFGWMLGRAFPQGEEPLGFAHPLTDFWHEHDFDTGPGGQTEVLWVDYRKADFEAQALEAHWLTQQAVVPIRGGALIQVLAPSLAGERAPDVANARAFLIEPGQGICMRPGAWHTSLVLAPTVTCMMLTRRSTTRDLVSHLRHQTPAQESSVVRLPQPLMVAAPPA